MHCAGSTTVALEPALTANRRSAPNAWQPYHGRHVVSTARTLPSGTCGRERKLRPPLCSTPLEPEAPKILDRLEVNLGAELKHPPGRIGVVRGDTPERAGRVEVLPCGNILRKREIGVVEDIECFQAKFNLLGFRERYQFAES